MRAYLPSTYLPPLLRTALAIAATCACILLIALFIAHGSFAAEAPRPNKQLLPNDCAAWNVVASPNPVLGTQFIYLSGVAAVSANDVWAVGNYFNGFLSQTLTEHWDGSVWTIVSSPNIGSRFNHLNGVTAVSANDIWAVGYYGNGVTASQTLIEHWDGSAWNIVPSPNIAAGSNVLNGIAAVSANDIWAVGDYYNAATYQTLIEHWDGSAWNTVPGPDAGAIHTDLTGIAVVSANDIWAVGYYDTTYTYQSLVEHWNGSAWTIVPSPDFGRRENALRGVAVVSANDIWAVGYYYGTYTHQTLTEHWDGSAWNIVPSPNLGTSINALNGIAAVSANDIWAVGDYFVPNGDQTLIEHWNGSAWSIVPSPSAVPGSNFLSGVAAVSANDIWAVGFYEHSSTYQTLTEHYTDNCSTTCTIQFNDVPSGSTFYPYVECLACRGIISGYECGGPGEPCPGSYFRPGANVTRGQVAKIVANSAGYSEQIPTTQQTFLDVPPSNTFWVYIERVHLHGDISGYDCGGEGEPCPGAYFRPANSLTRGQLSKIDANVAAYNDTIPPSQQTFSDVPPSSTFWVYIERVYLHGVISGYQCGGVGEPCPGAYFRPSNQVTRGQTSKIISNTFFPSCQTP